MRHLEVRIAHIVVLHHTAQDWPPVRSYGCATGWSTVCKARYTAEGSVATDLRTYFTVQTENAVLHDRVASLEEVTAEKLATIDVLRRQVKDLNDNMERLCPGGVGTGILRATKPNAQDSSKQMREQLMITVTDPTPPATPFHPHTHARTQTHTTHNTQHKNTTLWITGKSRATYQGFNL